MGRPKLKNKILEHNDEWLLVDISTPRFPTATMAVDADIFEAHDGGRIFADTGCMAKYIYASYNIDYRTKRFINDVLDVEDGMERDHITHGTMTFIDNRRSNLRAVTHSQNLMNRGKFKSNKSGIIGVYWDKRDNVWRAQIRLNGKVIHLGYFDNIEIAIGARQQAEREYFGEYNYEARK